jgi:hypothetical protein
MPSRAFAKATTLVAGLSFFTEYFASPRKWGQAGPKTRELPGQMSKPEIKELEKQLREMHFDPKKVFAEMQSEARFDSAH